MVKHGALEKYDIMLHQWTSMKTGLEFPVQLQTSIVQGNTKGGCITVPLTSCLTGLELAICQLKIFVFICKTD